MSNKRIKKKRTKDWCLCALCGKPLHDSARVVGKTGRGVCASCLRVSQPLLEHAKQPPVNMDALTPSAIVQELDKAIIGQEKAKRAVAVALWKQQLRRKGVDIPNPGLLLYGPTGCGKTALVREAARIAGLPFVSFDATTLTEAGYKGSHAEDMVALLSDRYSKEESENGIIFLDEVDKLAAQGGEQRMAYSRGTQHSLLKLIEGAEVNGINTSGILFLFGGAFSGLTTKEKVYSVPIGFDRIQAEVPDRAIQIADFVAYGMEPELMGRISRCVALSALTEENLRQILTSSSLSSFLRYQKFYQSRGMQLQLDKTAEDRIIRMALERGMGARGLNALVEEWMEEKLMELAEEG